MDTKTVTEGVVNCEPRGCNSRRETFTFADGGTVIIEVPDDGPPLTVAKTIYMLSNAQHQIHRMMEP